MENESRELDLIFNKRSYYRSVKFQNRKAKVKVFMHFNDLIDTYTKENYSKVINQIKKIRFFLYGYAGTFYNYTLDWGKDLLTKYGVDYKSLLNHEYEIENVEDIDINSLIDEFNNKTNSKGNLDKYSVTKNFFKKLKKPHINKNSILEHYSMYLQKQKTYNYLNEENDHLGFNVDTLDKLAKLASTCVNNQKEDLVDHWVDLDETGHEQFMIGKCSDIPVEVITTYDTKDNSNILIFTINNENYFIGFNTIKEDEE